MAKMPVYLPSLIKYMILIIVVKKIKHFNQNASIFSIINILIHDFNYYKKINKKLSIYRLKSVVVKKAFI